MTLSRETGLSLLYNMLKIRMTEEMIAEKYSEQEMRCPVHLSIGQEAVPAGVCESLIQGDMVFSTHRSHGHYLARGGSLDRMIAEIYGKVTGCSNGNGGSMHLIDIDAGFMGSTSIVSGTIPVATGAALGLVMKKKPGVTIAFFGDAAVEEGIFYESINFAVLHNLPIIFVCENNFYSVYSPLSVRQPSREIYSMVKGCGMHSYQADGNDVSTVYDLTNKALEKVRNGGGPIFLEFKTYRWREHCGPNYDNNIGYRDEAEFESWKELCPIIRFQDQLKLEKILDDSQLTIMKDEIYVEILNAFTYAKNSPFPEKEQLFKNIYA